MDPRRLLFIAGAVLERALCAASGLSGLRHGTMGCPMSLREIAFNSFTAPWFLGHSSVIGFLVYYGVLSFVIFTTMNRRALHELDAIPPPGAVVRMVVFVSILYGSTVALLLVVLLLSETIWVWIGALPAACIVCACIGVRRIWSGRIEEARRYLLPAMLIGIPILGYMTLLASALPYVG
jgi:hypothetical protein